MHYVLCTLSLSLSHSVNYALMMKSYDFVWTFASFSLFFYYFFLAAREKNPSSCEHGPKKIHWWKYANDGRPFRFIIPFPFFSALIFLNCFLFLLFSFFFVVLIAYSFSLFILLWVGIVKYYFRMSSNKSFFFLQQTKSMRAWTVPRKWKNNNT